MAAKLSYKQTASTKLVFKINQSSQNYLKLHLSYIFFYRFK